MGKYNRELQKIVNETPAPFNVNGPSREEALKIIAAISDQLKGPLSNTERLLLVSDRKAARDHLAKLDERA
jgi:hypothetical protein